MINVSLDSITEKHILGKWRRLSKGGGPATPSDIFAKASSIEFFPSGKFKSQNGNTVTGKWTMAKRNEIIYNPQIKFSLQEEEVGRAIITRLYNTPESNRSIFKLILYFDNGVEILLEKEAARTNSGRP